MIIKDIRIQNNNESLLLKAKCKIRRIGYDEVYFEIEKKYEDFLINDASPFAAALLIPSMKQGEDLIIDGPIPKKLYNGMKLIRDAFLSWDIGLSPVEIIADTLTNDTYKPRKIASFFSGGVDSFFTYLKHKNTTGKIDYFILINGFDINLTNKKLWLTTLSNIKQIAAEENVGLITVKSNIRNLIDPIFPWNFTHGGCLAAAGILISNGISKIYIPSSLTEEQQDPWGSNLLTDKLWSTEKLEFIHDGVEASRFNKIFSRVAKSEIARKHLRVCYSNKEGAYNCGNCEKCTRTMISLQIANALDKVKTFSQDSVDLRKLKKLKIFEDNLFFDEENLDALKERDMYPKLQKALSNCIERNRRKDSKTRIVLRKIIADSVYKKMIYLDHVYTKGQMNKIAKFILRK